MAFCLPGGFLRCLVTVVSRAGILKCAHNCFLDGADHSVFKVAVGVASGWLTRSCLEGFSEE